MNYYNDIKTKLLEEEAYQIVKDYSKERHKVITYFEIGKLLNEAGKHYGENIIKKYSKKLEVDVNKKYNERTLYRMIKLYNIFKEPTLTTLLSKLSWSTAMIISNLNDKQEILYYSEQSIIRFLSVRQLQKIINNKEYHRLSEKAKEKLSVKEQLSIEDYIKDPIVINTDKKIESERLLKQLILEDISSFMKQLGDGYSFIDSEYKILIDDRPNFIDILLYNIKFNCYVVIELKVTEVKKEHIGQIQIYMNYINKNVKTIYQDDTIGIIIAKKLNKYVISYSSDNRIFETTYKEK